MMARVIDRPTLFICVAAAVLLAVMVGLVILDGGQTVLIPTGDGTIVPVPSR
jgi:hypothetical protein